jgi:hypothetical protein
MDQSPVLDHLLDFLVVLLWFFLLSVAVVMEVGLKQCEEAGTKFYRPPPHTAAPWET